MNVIRDVGRGMRKHHDFSKARKNPYARPLKKQVALRLDSTALDYFKLLGSESGIG
jgi:uncharacterized protein (DUF4415 family)